MNFKKTYEEQSSTCIILIAIQILNPNICCDHHSLISFRS